MNTKNFDGPSWLISGATTLAVGFLMWKGLYAFTIPCFTLWASGLWFMCQMRESAECRAQIEKNWQDIADISRRLEENKAAVAKLELERAANQDAMRKLGVPIL